MKTTVVTGVLLASITLAPNALRADERDDRIRALEKRVEQLEKILQEREARDAKAASPIEMPKATEAPKPLPTVSIGSSGFIMRSADSNFVLRLRGLIQVDSRWSDDDDITDSFVLRRARPIIEGTVFRDFDFQFTPEFGGSSTVVRDAYVNYRYNEALQFRAGKMKSPGNLERWQPVAAHPFVERSFVSSLWPVRELGFMLHGQLWPSDDDFAKSLAAEGLVNYAVGLFNGTGDGRAADNSDFDSDKTFEGRLFFHPFLKSGSKPIERFGIGVSGNYGEMQGDRGLPDDFSYLGAVTADGLQWRLGPQAYWYWGPFGLYGEYSISSQRLEREAAPFTSLCAENTAWTVGASWMLTGEESTFRTLTPRKNFDPHVGGWGALQAVIRYSYFDLDNDLFPNFADSMELPTRAESWSFGLNWYLNRNVRASFNYIYTDLKGGQSGSVGDFGKNALLTRLQVAF